MPVFERNLLLPACAIFRCVCKAVYGGVYPTIELVRTELSSHWQAFLIGIFSDM
jgi:hypothetical protein